MTDNTNPAVAKAADKVIDATATAIKTAARSTDTEAKAPAKPKGNPVAYTADRDVYVDNVYTKAGGVFVTNQPKSEYWTKVSPKEAAAIEASTNKVPDDANLEAADKAALQAVAIIKHINITGLDKPALITAIKAAYEPAL